MRPSVDIVFLEFALAFLFLLRSSAASNSLSVSRGVESPSSRITLGGKHLSLSAIGGAE